MDDAPPADSRVAVADAVEQKRDRAQRQDGLLAISVPEVESSRFHQGLRHRERLVVRVRPWLRRLLGDQVLQAAQHVPCRGLDVPLEGSVRLYGGLDTWSAAEVAAERGEPRVPLGANLGHPGDGVG